VSGAAGIDMIAPVSEPADPEKDQVRAIATLSDKLHLPMQEVREVYLREFGRLESQARIRNFLGVLALSRTRSALRCGNRPRASG
jgi:hypothetical protein